MKLFFLFITFCLILTVHAQRPVQQYTCSLSHGEDVMNFYLKLNKSRRLMINNQSIEVMVSQKQEMVDISIVRTITGQNTTHSRSQNKLFPLDARKLLVELSQQGNHLMFECVPRDP